MVVCEKPSNHRRSVASAYPYTTAQELRTLAGIVGARDWTTCTVRSYRYQAIPHYNQIPMEYRSLGQEKFKASVKKWARTNMILFLLYNVKSNNNSLLNPIGIH